MRKYIIVALLLVAIGIGVSFFLLPSASDVMVAQQRDQATVDMGSVDVEAEYNQGRRTFPIISGLADKRVAEGNRPAAVTLLEEYVSANPNDAQGRKKLAEQYQLSGNQEKYNEQLVAIAQAEPTEANLKVLSDVYNADKNYPKQVEVLKKLVEVNKGENPQYFVDLATIQVAVGSKDDALATLATLKDKHPEYTSYSVTRIKVSILSEQGKTDEAFAEAKQWVDAAPVPTTPTEVPQGITPDATVSAPATQTNKSAIELGDLTNILNYSGHPDKAVELAEPHKDWIDTSTELAVAYVNAMINVGRTDEAYQLLADIEAKGNMVPDLYVPYMQLALKRNDVAAAEQIANTLKPEAFNEEQALNIVEVARAGNAPTVLAVLETRFDTPEILKDKPVLAAVLSILTNKKDQDQRIETALNVELTSLQKLRLAETCARNNKTACFDAILAQYPSVDQMTTPQIAEYSQLYIIANRPADVIDAVGLQAAKPDAHPDVVLAHTRLGAAAGRKDITVPWLETNANTVQMAKLQDLFFLANDRKHGEVSTDIAERLYARDPSPMNRDILIAAYVGNNQHEKALPLVRAQMQQTPEADDSMYLATLSKVGRKDKEARKELVTYAENALKTGRGDDKAQLNYAYALLNNGERAKAMPYIQAYSKDRGGEWRKMYAQLTAKPGKGAPAKKLTREERIAMAANPKISDANKREIAFSLLNDGHKADATNIFAALAANKGPDSQEMKDLLFMWGGKLNAEQMAWIQKRAAAAPAYEQQGWAQLINNYGDDYAVMQYVSATPTALYDRTLRRKYFSVLAQTGNKAYFDQGMRDWVAQTTDVPALLDYSNTALAFGYKDAAFNGYKRVEALDPNNAKALDALAQINFGKGSYSQADQYINRAIVSAQAAPAEDVDPAQAHFLKAEMLKRSGNIPAAQAEYNQVIQYTLAAPTQEPSKLSRLYSAMFNTGQHSQAMQGFSNLLATYPDDKGILADYMAALIENKYYDEATRIANQYDKSSPYYGKGAALMGASKYVSGIQRASQGRELTISFSRPTEEAVKLDQPTDVAWLERKEVSYDSVTLSAKPGYIVRYVPTANDQFAVVSAPAAQVSPQVDAQRQQDLRLQLLYARIEQETGQTQKAQQRLLALQQYYPQDSQLLGYRASVEGMAGNTKEAKQLVSQAQRYAPENEDLAKLQQNLDYSARSTARNLAGGGPQFIKLDHEYRSYGAHDEQITTLSGVANLPANNEFGFSVQHDAINPDDMVLPSTGETTDNNTSRENAELFLAHYFDSGNRLQGSLFLDSAIEAGAGGYYSFGNALGRTEVLAEYHKPYWDYPQAVFAYANRDRVGFRHFANLDTENSLGLEGSINNYNIKLEDDQVQTGLFRLSLVHQLQAQTSDQPYFGIGYGFDGEYKLAGHDWNLRSSTGTHYHPFDWRSREVHFFSGIYRDDWTPTTHALLVAGYAVDRLNEDGPAVEARITQDLTDQWELGLRGRYGIITSGGADVGDSDNDAINLGAHLMYKF